jgi:hypothetical protein
MPEGMETSAMRSVVIVNDPKNQRPWVVVDRQDGLELFRLQNRDQLVKICTRLGWVIAAAGLKPRTPIATVQRAFGKLTRRVAPRRGRHAA